MFNIFTGFYPTKYPSENKVISVNMDGAIFGHVIKTQIYAHVRIFKHSEEYN